MHQNPHQLFSQGTGLPLANTESQLPWFTKTTNLGDTLMKSSVIKRSIMIDGHKTSVSLEDAFWRGLKEIARGQQATLSNVVAEIDKARQRGNLSSAIRLFVLDRVRAPSTTGPAMLSSRETEKAASPDGLLQPQI
jgi:predicted DNA-binding ribbon-helix-helix protein